MSRVLLQCSSQVDADYVKQLLEMHVFQVQLSFDNLSTRSTLQYENEKIQLLVLIKSEFTEKDFRFSLEIKKNGFDKSILILANNLDYPEFFTHSDREAIHLLEKPFEDKDLVAISKKLIANPMVKEQRHRRYATRQDVTIESLTSGHTESSQMLNLSLGGAYCEGDKPSHLKEGDLVKINVGLNDLDSERIMSGRIVWKTAMGRHGEPGLGVEFLKSHDVYRLLMEKM